MKTTVFGLDGKALHLCLNGAALFDIYDKYGAEQSIPELIQGESKASFLATCWILAKLAEQGELVRRWQGHDRGWAPTAGQLQTLLRPTEVLLARRAIEEALRLGFAREETDPNEEIDLGLIELQKKTASISPAPSFWTWLRSFFA